LNSSIKDLIAETKKNYPISFVVKQYIDLGRREGRNYLTHCPFHGDRSSSFLVTYNRESDHQGFKCTACNIKGDVIDFVRLWYKEYNSKEISIREAIAIINGVEIKAEDYAVKDDDFYSNNNNNLFENKTLDEVALEFYLNGIQKDSIDNYFIANTLKHLYKFFDDDFIAKERIELADFSWLGVFKEFGNTKKTFYYYKTSISITNDTTKKVECIVYRNKAFLNYKNNLVDYSKAPPKWKYELNSNSSYIKHRIKNEDDFVFFAFGAAELIAFEIILDCSYVSFLSDSTATGLQKRDDILDKLTNKVCLICTDYDNSCFNATLKLIEILESRNIDYYVSYFGTFAVEKKIKGFDLRDFLNMLAEKKKAEVNNNNVCRKYLLDTSINCILDNNMNKKQLKEPINEL